MIEIIVHGGNRIDLPADLTLNIVQENPLFIQDRIPAPYTVQFDIPATTNNLLIFGMPGRVASTSLVKKLPSDIRLDGFIIMRGHILLLGSEKLPKVQFVGSSFIDNLEKNLNALDLGEYDYGSVPVHPDDINYNHQWANEYKIAMQNAANNGQPFALAPMRIKDESWEGDSDTSNGTLNTLKQYINYFNAKDFNLLPSNDYYCHSPILPSPYLKDVINAAFGDKLLDSPFNSGDFTNLVLPAMNHPYFSWDNLWNYSMGNQGTGMHQVFFPLIDDWEQNGNTRALRFKLGSFQQAYPFNELLKNILKIFGMSAFPGYNWRIERNDDIMDRSVVHSWDTKIVGTIIEEYQDAQQYQFSFGSTSKEVSKNVRTFNNLNELYQFAMVIFDNSDYFLEDASSGAVYKVNKLTTADAPSFQKILRCEIFKSPLSYYYEAQEKEKYQITSEVKPLEMNIEPFWAQDTNIIRGHWHVPVLERKAIDEAPHIMFRAATSFTLPAGLSNPSDQGGAYPYFTSNNKTTGGIQLFDFSLHPGGSDGLISKFHSRFKSWVEKDKKRLKVTVKLSASEIRNLNMRDKFHVRGRLFYIEKIEYQLRNSGFSLVEADMIEC